MKCLKFELTRRQTRHEQVSGSADDAAARAKRMAGTQVARSLAIAECNGIQIEPVYEIMRRIAFV